MDQREHWEKVYATRETNEVGWYKPHLETSLQWIRELDLPKDAGIIDVGGGASTLVEDLLEDGYSALTVLDLSVAALDRVQARMGAQYRRVVWRVGDITTIALPEHQYSLWHDRAAFHFLTEPEQQELYRDQLLRALKPGGHVIIGAFSPAAPPTCSGLPVRRYTPEELAQVLGPQFELTRHHHELHVTPGRVEQMYLYCRFHRLP